jgi:hypothetical protein
MRCFLLVLSLVILSGCEPDLNGLDTEAPGEVKVPIVIENSSGQVTITISYSSLKQWLESNKCIRIVSICGIDKGGNGVTSAFVIVYEKAVNSKCSSCGQGLPAEKAN